MSFLLKTLHAQVPQDTDDKALMGTGTGSYRNNAKEENSDCFSRVSPLLSEEGLIAQLRPKYDLKLAGLAMDYKVKVYQTTGNP